MPRPGGGARLASPGRSRDVSDTPPRIAHRDPFSPLRVLFVCTGNVCRSPVAVWAWERALAATGEVARASSAGHGALVGADVDPLAERAARAAGLTPAPHRARQLGVSDVTSAHLVLALDREARRAAVALVPRASASSFTLVEFGRLVADVAASGVEVGVGGVVAAAASRRGFVVGPRDRGADDIPDPYGRPFRVHVAVVDRIVAETDRIVAALGSVAAARSAHA